MIMIMIMIAFSYMIMLTIDIVEMDSQSQSNVEEKVKSLISEDDESTDDVQNDQSEKQNT